MMCLTDMVENSQHTGTIPQTAMQHLYLVSLQVNFTVPRVLQRPWYVYYSLHNYYQNHRRYLNSWDPGQLRGSGLTTPSSNCRPLQNSPDINGTEKSVFPCGLVANSWFNGTRTV